MEYLSEILWMSLWPLIIFIGWKLSLSNIKKFDSKSSK